MIQNLEVEVDIDIMTELFELKISIRSKVFNLLLMEWSERRDFCCLNPKTAGESIPPSPPPCGFSKNLSSKEKVKL